MLRREFLLLTLSLLSNQNDTVQAGDILLTRNFGGEEINTSPGYYNHSAIVGPLNWVIEAQQTPNSIIAVPIWNFFDRYPEILVLRNINASIAEQTAQTATLFVGRTYAKYMSVRPMFLWKYNDNCTSLIKRIYNKVTSKVYRWIIPDDFLRTPWLNRVSLKKDYENFVKPENNYVGMQKTWPNSPAKKYDN